MTKTKEMEMITEYKRECSHGEICNWKECAECREFLVRKGFEEVLTAHEQSVRESVAKEIEGRKRKNDDNESGIFIPTVAEIGYSYFNEALTLAAKIALGEKNI